MYVDVTGVGSCYATLPLSFIRGDVPHFVRITISNGYIKIFVDGILRGISNYNIDFILTGRIVRKVFVGNMNNLGNSTNACNFVFSDLSVSNIDRGDTFATLPQDFIDGYADIAPAMDGQRKVHSDALTSQYTIGIAKGDGTEHSKGIEVIQATKGQWKSGDTVKVRGSAGGIISGVIDSDTALATVVESVSNGTTFKLNDVSRFSINDMFKWYDPVSGTVSSLDYTVLSVDAIDKTIMISSTSFSADVGYLFVEVTAISSSPVVKVIDGYTLSSAIGTWTGLGTNEATFKLGTNTNLTTEDIEIHYSINIENGQGVIPVFKETLGGEANGEKLDVGTVAVIDDFRGKVTENTAINPNKVFEKCATTLQTPSTFTLEFTENKYSAISKLDTTLASTSVSQNGYIPQQLLTFDLIRIVEDKFGTIKAIDKVKWLKNNLDTIKISTVAYGSSCNKNLLRGYIWYNPTSSWSEYKSNISDKPTLDTWTIIYNIGGWLNGGICNDGSIQFLLATDANDGLSASSIYLDYAQLELKLKMPTGYDILVPENPRRDAGKSNILMIQKETKTVESFFDAVNTDGLVTYGEYIPYQGIAEMGQTWFNKDKVLAELYSMSTIGTGKVCSDKNAMYKGASTRLPIQVIKDYQLNSDIKINGETTEFVRIPSLVPVAYGNFNSILYREISSSINVSNHAVERGYRNSIFGSSDKGFLMSKSSIPVISKGYTQHVVAYLVQRKLDGQIYMIINTSTNNEGIFSTTGRGNYATDVYRLEGRPLIKEA